VDILVQKGLGFAKPTLDKWEKTLHDPMGDWERQTGVSWPAEARGRWLEEWKKLPASQHTLEKANDITWRVTQEYHDLAKGAHNEKLRAPGEAMASESGDPFVVTDGAIEKNLDATVASLWGAQKEMESQVKSQPKDDPTYEFTVNRAALKAFDDGYTIGPFNFPDSSADVYGKISVTGLQGSGLERQDVWSKAYEQASAHDDMKVGTEFRLKPGLAVRSKEGFGLHADVMDKEGVIGKPDTVGYGTAWWRKGDREGQYTHTFTGEDGGKIEVIYDVKRLPGQQGQVLVPQKVVDSDGAGAAPAEQSMVQNHMLPGEDAITDETGMSLTKHDQEVLSRAESDFSHIVTGVDSLTRDPDPYDQDVLAINGSLSRLVTMDKESLRDPNSMKRL
jgi:hypothetical protein